MSVTETRTCPQCRRTKPANADYWYTHHANPSGFMRVCKACQGIGARSGASIPHAERGRVRVDASFDEDSPEAREFARLLKEHGSKGAAIRAALLASARKRKKED